MARLVFPVGQFGGVVRGDSPTDVRFRIRRGNAVFTIEPEPGALWLAAHGRREKIATTEWTRDAVTRGRAPTDPVADGIRWGTLTGNGLIAEIDPNGAEAVEFARTHRLVPRMHGLGNRSEQPNVFMAGYAPDGVATFTWHQWRLWRESHLEPSLWDGCERQVENERRAGRRVDARFLLADTLRGMHIMLGFQLAYLDVAR